MIENAHITHPLQSTLGYPSSSFPPFLPMFLCKAEGGLQTNIKYFLEGGTKNECWANINRFLFHYIWLLLGCFPFGQVQTLFVMVQHPIAS